MNDGEAVDFLAKNGLPRNAAVGVVDVLRAESGMDPTALNLKEGAYGIAQWVGSRKVNLQAYAEQEHEPVESMKLQLKFLLHELETVEKGTLERLQLTKTVDEAIHVWVTGFERPENDAEVEARAQKEGGQPFGPSPSSPGALTAPPASATQTSVHKYDYHEKVVKTGKEASQHGNALGDAIKHTRGLIGRLPRFRG